MAVALANDPVVILADEPTGELDHGSAAVVLLHPAAPQDSFGHVGVRGGVPAVGDADAAAHHALRVGEVADPFRAAVDLQKQLLQAGIGEHDVLSEQRPHRVVADQRRRRPDRRS